MCSLVLVIAGVLCSAGGIFVAIIMVVGDLSRHNALPRTLSALVRCLRSKEGSGGINWDMCRLVMPGALVCTYLGVRLNFHVDDCVIVVFLTIVFVGMTRS